MKLADVINFKVAETAGTLLALHTFVYGLSFIIDDSVKSTIIYAQASNAMPIVAWSIALMLAGLVTIYGFFKSNDKIVAFGGQAQAIMYLFVTLLYLFNYKIMFALLGGISWLLLIAYNSYTYSHRRDFLVLHDGKILTRVRKELDDQ